MIHVLFLSQKDNLRYSLLYKLPPSQEPPKLAKKYKNSIERERVRAERDKKMRRILHFVALSIKVGNDYTYKPHSNFRLSFMIMTREINFDRIVIPYLVWLCALAEEEKITPINHHSSTSSRHLLVGKIDF